MYLKHLRVQGFKSFADRTDFDFGAGITAVVGPNGCGKSNVLDAVRWVLGEQSARTLRGSKMLDVIFSGSRSRKPANTADVELTFDNRDGRLRVDTAEVNVGRTLYRSGESEYRINGRPVRLRDVRDLFLDTGVGVDAYSFIEQGRVDAMLQASPAQRREIFEEAAGISRYRVRRTEAQRKLERTQNNLLRLNDVIDELERRLRSVKLAAGKARSFREYDQQLRELRGGFSLAEYHDLIRSQRSAESTLRRYEMLLSVLRHRLAEADAASAELQTRAEALDAQVEAREAELRRVEAECSATDERAGHCRRRIEELSAAQKQAVRRHESLLAECAALESRRDEERSRLEDLERQAEAAEEGMRTAEAESAAAAAALAALSPRQAALEARGQTCVRELTRLASLVQALDETREHIERQRTALAARRSSLETRRDAAHTVAEQALQRTDEIDAQLAALRHEMHQRENTIQTLQRERGRLGERIGDAKEQRSAVLSRQRLLEDLERRFEGVDQGPRWMLEWRASEADDGSVCGLVADVFRIDDPRLDRLEGLLRHVENTVVAASRRQLLDAFTQHGDPPGPVDVVCLDHLTRRRFDADALSAVRGYEGVGGCVVDWVRCDARFRPLAEHLFGHVFLIDSAEAALRCLQTAPASTCFVLPDGRALFGDGRVLAGRGGARHSLMSRKAEIRRLAGELDEVETLVERLSREAAAVDERLSDERVHRDALLDQTAVLQREHADSRDGLKRAEGELEQLDQQLAALAGERESLADRYAETLAHLAAHRESSHALEAQRRRYGEWLAEMEQRVDAARAADAAAREALSAAKVEHGRVAERRTAQAQALREVEQQCDRTRRDVGGAASTIAEGAERLAGAEAERVAVDDRLTVLQDQTAAAGSAVEQVRRSLRGVRGEIERRSATIRAMHERIDEADGLARRSEVGGRESGVRRENLVGRVREELSLELPELHASYTPEQRDWEAVRAEIDDLRGRIERLGNVNLDALDELEELTPRYDELLAQRGDVESSIGQLTHLIEELDVECRSRFTAHFDEIRKNFQALFRKLFGGGKADVILDDPDNPLESGIEIVARPPGKEPQSISLLSGGEKTLSAVALLFAVFQCKPSPFAFLDEVDAALDEANIERFNQVVREFLDHSQFIVITHSKQTMQCADVLYGVTQQEPGVSKRVSVRFDDRVQTPSVA